MRILVVGISVRAMVESAVRSGYQVVALDAFGDQDLKELTESYALHHDFHTAYSPGALYKAGQTLSFDAITYTSNLENHPDILARFGDSRRIIGNVPQVVTSVRNWAALFESLKHAGFTVPETIFTGEVRPAGSRCRWLLKPMLSGGGHGIRYYNPEIQYLPANENRFCVPGFMLQEYIPGRPCSASFIANANECAVLGICEQLIGEHSLGSRGFRYCGNLLPVPEAIDPGSGNIILDKVRRLAEFLTKKYELIGLNGFDFILRGDQIYLIEVNPRYSASMEIIEIAYELPVFHLHTQSILYGNLPEFDLETELNKGKFYGKSYLYAEKDVTAPDTGGWYERGIRDIPESGEKIRKGGPVCTILAGNPSGEETLSEMIRQAQDIKEEMYA